jgi:hypothetical protein
MASQEIAELGEEAREVFSRILLERIRQETYPSRTHMDILEQTLPPSLYRDYLNILLEKVLAETHPSIPMLRRISRISASL